MENTEEVDHQEHGRENEKVEGKTSVSNWRLRKRLSPYEKDLRNDAEECELESTRAKIGEAREENERLKTVLSRIVKDYQSLQMHFFDIVQQEQSKKPVENSPKPIDHHDEGAHELVSLSLGASAKAIIMKEEKGSQLGFDNVLRSDGLTLGLERKNIETSSFEDVKDVDLRVEDDEIAPQSNPAKRARVSVRARCDGPTMNDGCQWRKYGQKVSKGNPCPRAYYRCSVAPGCPVRKQVQRCIGDMSILITTYEGTHDHPLPISAAAMASTTSAAAHMLTSGPSSPRPATGSTSLASAFYISNPYRSTSHPTITLDLTSNSNSNSNSNSTSTISQYLQYPAGPSQQSHWQKALTSGLSYSYPLSMDMITRAITSDPSFQSALVAAITSYVGAWGDGQLGSTSAFRGGSGGSTPVVLGPVAGLTGTESSGPTVDERKERD